MEADGKTSEDGAARSEMPHDVRVALKNAILLRKFAIERNKNIDDDVNRILAEIRIEDAIGKWSADDEVKFWNAYRKLNSIISPINADTIRAIRPEESKPGGRGGVFSKFRSKSPASVATRKYRYWGLIALLYVLYLQIYLALGSSLLSDLKKFCPSLTGVEVQTPAFQNSPLQNNESTLSVNAATTDAKCRTLLSLRQNQGREDTFNNIADNIKNDAILLYSILGGIDNINKLNILWGFREFFHEDQFNYIYQPIQSIYYLELGLKIIRDYLLPLLYGLLGTCAYIIRTVSVEIQNVLYSQETHSRYQLRLFLGALAGLSAAWFIDLDNQKVIPAAALSFLAGYSVELVFAAMDRLVAAFGAESGRTRVEEASRRDARSGGE
jgi:hypothetical protein